MVAPIATRQPTVVPAGRSQAAPSAGAGPARAAGSAPEEQDSRNSNS